jgi:hypothetical protein
VAECLGWCAGWLKYMAVGSISNVSCHGGSGWMVEINFGYHHRGHHSLSISHLLMIIGRK